MNIRFLRNTGVAGKPYKKGDVADLSDAIAKDFIRRGRAEAVISTEDDTIAPAETPVTKDTPPPADRLAEVARVIMCLDPESSDNFTKDGDVRCDVLSDKCGFDVSADMRDDAVALLEEQQPNVEAVKNDGDDNTAS